MLDIQISEIPVNFEIPEFGLFLEFKRIQVFLKHMKTVEILESYPITVQ
jgi:hypothetical protein